MVRLDYAPDHIVRTETGTELDVDDVDVDAHWCDVVSNSFDARNVTKWDDSGVANYLVLVHHCTHYMLCCTVVAW